MNFPFGFFLRQCFQNWSNVEIVLTFSFPSGRMAVRSRCMYSEIWSQMWRHNRAVEWADLGFVGFCPERQISVWNGRSNQLEDMSIK